MFKKVIGQNSRESQKQSLTASIELSALGSLPNSTADALISSPPASPAKPQPSSMRNVLSSDVEIKGIVKFEHELIVDGKIEGEILSTGNLTAGENARINAEIKTGTFVIYGKVHGNITVTDRVELKATAEVIGDIKAKTLVVDAGAIFIGKSPVGTPTPAETASKPASASPLSSKPAQEATDSLAIS